MGNYPFPAHAIPPTRTVKFGTRLLKVSKSLRRGANFHHKGQGFLIILLAMLALPLKMLKMAQRCPQEGPRRPQDGPKRLQDDPKMAPRRSQDGHVPSKFSPIFLQVGIFSAMFGQVASKSPPRWLKLATWLNLASSWPHLASSWTSKLPPRWPQDASR